jgi:membrane protease YdiL (CAAX protease family)
MSLGADNGRLGDASAGLVAVVLVRILVLSPVAEELLFRGALYCWLRTRLSAPWTIGLTGAAFAVIHWSPTFLPLALVVGLAAGWIRERTGSVLVTMAAHALQSLLIVALSLALTGWDAPALLG